MTAVEAPPAEEEALRPEPARELRAGAPDRRIRRFSWAVIAGAVVAAIPFLWLLWDNWTGSIHFLAREPNADFYDAQAKSIMHGTLAIRQSILGIEAFHHGSHYYTYFGIFPSLLRIPFLLVAPGLYGQLTAPSMLLAWIVTAVMSSLLIWRVRVLVRDSAVLARAEAISYGVLVAVICGGSVFLLLGATPWVYDEDLAWSIALTVGAMFALLGVLERPTTRRVLLAGGFILCANLNRLPTGWSCVIGALLVAGWFATGRGGDANRRWALPMLAVALIPLAAGCAVNTLKFGVPFGLPFADQVWTHVNAHRRVFLARSGGKGYGLEFLPTTLWTYFQPFGIRLQSVFPFVTLPATPPEIFGGAVFDQTYRTASIPSSMPLLFLLTCFGTVVTFMRGRSVTAKLVRIPLIAAAFGCGVTLVWGYIAPRFEADMVPLLVVGGAAGTVHVWRLLEGRRAPARRSALAAVGALGLFGIVANFGIAAVPNPEWNGQQIPNFVDFQKTVSDVTGHPLQAQVVRGESPPYYAPAGELFVAGNCTGLYISTGESYSNQPVQQREHTTWLVVEGGPGILSTLRVNISSNVKTPSSPIPLISSGSYTVSLQIVSYGNVKFVFDGPGTRQVSNRQRVHFGKPIFVQVYMEPNLHQFGVTLERGEVFSGVLPQGGPIDVHAQTGQSGTGQPDVNVAPVEARVQGLPLCEDFLKGT